jgi:hypothetical protein
LGIDVLCFAVVVFFYDFCGFHSPPPLLFSSHSYILLSIIRVARSHKCIGEYIVLSVFVDEILLFSLSDPKSVHWRGLNPLSS